MFLVRVVLHGFRGVDLEWRRVRGRAEAALDRFCSLLRVVLGGVPAAQLF